MVWLVRHGESAGNVALREAERTGRPMSDIAERDVDFPLSPLGERQSRALGRWFRSKPETEQPTIVLSSPYVRAMQTAQHIAEQGWSRDRHVVHLVDERLREKEYGMFSGLTKAGIAAQYPDQAAFRDRVGKFYFRPPGGESWCDVILRLRSVLNTIQVQHVSERVLIVAHQVVVLCFRYLIEHMTEEQILTIDRDDVANCSLTTYEFDRDGQGRGGLALRQFNVVTPLEDAGAPVTTQPDPPIVPH